ncbi:uncharacterized protein LOC111321911 isoform X2 [Stylophora pistillata]|uniref:uncharacterized protein LOC111321911 isoform X2 n=1 Tax=Stylophora pistillata TaxID=50429 RepID=UPI000C04BAC5|nr:uncharacterized protein LOC111321911 isoform X2 [Stylophora pistillata]
MRLIPKHRMFGLFSWFSDYILIFPVQLINLLQETFGSASSLIRVFCGRRNLNTSNPFHSQFLYFVSEEIVLVVTKDNGILSAALHDPLPVGVDLIEWSPDQKFLRKINFDVHVECALDATEEPLSLASPLPKDMIHNKPGTFTNNSWETLSYQDIKNLMMVGLLKGFSQEHFNDVLDLFHEIMGDDSLDFELDVSSNIPVILNKRTQRIIQQVSEGTFSAFVVAALVVCPFTHTLIFDEVARGMHPLQVRRLRTILMRESRNRRKCIITTTHSPEVVEVERITLIWRFQVLPSGYYQIKHVRSHYNVRDLHFLGGAEVREIFFARYVIWVEGESDKRFIEALLRLFDEGNMELFNALVEPGMEAKLSRGPDCTGHSLKQVTKGLSLAVQNLLLDPAYKRVYYGKEVLSAIQQGIRSCAVLSINGKKNIYKAKAICHDLGIPHAVVCDLDVIIPNSKENSVQSQFNKCNGVWANACIPNAKTKLLDEDQCPASRCVRDSSPGLIPKLRACRTVAEVMNFYDKMQHIFTWHVDGGEIEDAIRLTKSQFGKKLWPDLSFEEVKELVVGLLQPCKLQQGSSQDNNASKTPNPELLRCIFFLFDFFSQSTMNS